MADITKCKGFFCPKKDACYRYTAPKSERQSWFMKVPYTYEGSKFICYEFYERKAKDSFINDFFGGIFK